MTTAFVLTGGASLGAVHVGMADALLSEGIRPDLLVGSSAGALNGAWLAGHPGPGGVAELAELWSTVRRRQIFPFSPLRITLGLLGRRDHVVSAKRLAGWLEARLPFTQLEQATVPLHVMATDLMTGAPIRLSSGRALDALLASSAIPGLYPPVQLDGRLLVDGGIAADMPITQAVQLGADTVYVLPTVTIPAGARPTRASSVAFQALGHLVAYTSDNEIARNADRCRLYVVPAPVTRFVSPFDFTHARELMEAARTSTRSWLPLAKPEEPVLT